MKSNILIVEDEPIIADDIAIIVEEIGYRVEGIADSWITAEPIVETGKIDLVMLDIGLKGKDSGIDIGHYLNHKYKLPFLYLTSYFDEATVKKAEETNPGAYLVKPFKESDLKASIQLTIGKRKNQYQIEHRKIQPLKLFIKKEGVLTPLNPDDILYIEASDNYSEIHTNDGKIVVSKTLKTLEESFDEAGFARIHKSYFVNISKVDAVDHNMVYVKDKGMPIGRVYRESFLNKLTII